MAEHDMDSLELRMQYEEDEWRAHVAACTLPLAACPACSAAFGLEQKS